MTTQLRKLAQPFPDRFINSNPSGGGSYVAHDVVTQRLLAILGGVSTERVEIIYDDLPAIEPNPSASSKRAKAGHRALPHCLVGVVLRMTAEVDGCTTVVEEVGDCEDPYNWPHNGARGKDAFSDAYKRCAMRLGVALHLWSQADYVLPSWLDALAEEVAAA